MGPEASRGIPVPKGPGGGDWNGGHSGPKGRPARREGANEGAPNFGGPKVFREGGWGASQFGGPES